MRVYIWLATFLFCLSGQASAQNGLDQMHELARQLEKLSSIAAGDSRVAGQPAQQVIGILSQPEHMAADKGPSTPAASAGWNALTMTACIAFVYGSNQYNLAYFSTGAAFVTQSSYAIPVLAANCASGKIFLVYLESDRTTVTAVASYPR